MITVLKNAHVYEPRNLGCQNVVFINGRIVAVSNDTEQYERLDQAKIYDCTGKYLVPGFIDLHVHILGAGGEQGPASRCPEAKVGEIFSCGCTTILGMMGIDGTSRSNESLITKARALTDEGLTCYALISNYVIPVETVTGSIEKDITMIDPVIGVKSVLAEPKASFPTDNELIRIATAIRRGGLLSGKAGLIVFHIGSSPDRMSALLRLAKQEIVPIKHFLPTHTNPWQDSITSSQSEEFIEMGGTVDYTAGFNDEQLEITTKALANHYRKYKNLNHITLSSDSYGSCPELDEFGNVIGMCYATGKYLIKVLSKITMEYEIPLEEGLKLLTSNPARVLCMEKAKGHIQPGADADLLLLDNQFRVHTLFAKGELAVKDTIVLKNGFYSNS